MIIVVGAGIAGSCLVRHLDERGIDYRHIADRGAASTAAVALLRRAYHHGDQLALFDRSLELFKKWHVPVLQGGWVTNYRTPDREPRHETDWYVVDPLAPLINPQHRGRALAVHEGIVWAGHELAGDRVLWATGASVKPTGITYGVTWVHQNQLALAMPGKLRLHHFAPYKTIAAVLVNGEVRLGSSSARTDTGAIEQARKMLAAAYEVGMITTVTGWTAEIGIRCKGAELELPAGQRYVGGLHRTGYAVAPALTERLVESL